MKTKERITELAKRLREASSSDPIARHAVELVKLCAEDAKDRLVHTVDSDMMRSQQGAAQAYAWLYRELTRTPPTQTQPTQEA